MTDRVQINPALWDASRAGARSGRGFRYQDAVSAGLAVDAWSGAGWTVVVPEGLDDITLHGCGCEYRVQVKARHDPRGTFSSLEVAQHLLKSSATVDGDDLRTGRVQLTLVIERPAADFDQTGWAMSLGKDEAAVEALRPHLGDTMANLGIVEFLSACHLVVDTDPIGSATVLIAGRTGMVDAAARIVAHDLRLDVGLMSDRNYLAPAEAPAVMVIDDVARAIDRVSSLTDPASMHSALALGLCEIVDFTPIAEPNFYEGVDATPGHVGAGLVLDRPELIGELQKALERRRSALVAGPSGSGKSATAWLFAEQMRHAVRWYRVRSLGADQASSLIDLSRRLEATADRPVGFVLDDLGRDSVGGWDALVREAAHEPGLLLLGTIREEDLFLVGSLAATTLVRPRLDDALAERIFAALGPDGAGNFAHWREPCELARGLLLEYVHLLTSGKRLQETLDDQVRRRLAETRDSELEILLAVVSVARHGGSVDQDLLRSRLGLSVPAFARALARLADEHALRVTDDGSIAGLHEIRSRGLHDALRRMVPTGLVDEVAISIGVLRASDLPVVLPRLMREEDIGDGIVLDALARRAPSLPSLGLTALFHGLGLVMCDRIAARWCGICADIEIPEQVVATAFTLAIVDQVIDNPTSAKVYEAKARFMELETADLRVDLIERAGLSQLPSPETLEGFHELAASLAPIAFVTGTAEPAMPVRPEWAETAIRDLLKVVATLREFGVGPAQAAIAVFGGIDRLLERIHVETAWVTRPTVYDEDGFKIASSNYRYVAPSIQPDPNGSVVTLCEMLGAAVPDADLLVSDAVGWDGRPAGMQDINVATKRLTRDAIPPPVRVAWNRAILRAIQRQLGTPTETGRADALAGAMRDLSPILSAAAETYCRGGVATNEETLKLSIRALLNNFIRASAVGDEARSPLDLGRYDTVDKTKNWVDAVTTLTQKLVAPDIDHPLLLSSEAAELARQADELKTSPDWKWLAEVPVQAIGDCGETLAALEAVLGDAHREPEGFRISRLRAQRSSRHNRALMRFAADARQRASDRAMAMTSEIETAFQEAGFEATIGMRPPIKEKIPLWPRVEHAVLLHVPNIDGFFESAERAVAVTRTFPDHFRVYFAPVVDGYVVPNFAGQQAATFVPDLGFAEKWATHLPLPIVPADAVAAFNDATAAITELSGMNACADRLPNEEELRHLKERNAGLAARLKRLQDLASEAPDQDINNAIEFVSLALERLAIEYSPEFAGTPMAADFSRLLRGELTEFSAMNIQLVMRLVERDAAVAAAARDASDP